MDCRRGMRGRSAGPRWCGRRPDGYLIAGIDVPQISILPMLQDVGFEGERSCPSTGAAGRRTCWPAGRTRIRDHERAGGVREGETRQGEDRSTSTNSLGRTAALLIGKAAGVTFGDVPFTGTAA